MSEKPDKTGKKADQNVPKKPKKERNLTKRQAIFVANIIAGKSQVQSAVAAGSKEVSANKAAARYMQNPIVRKAIEEDREKARERGIYNLERAMQEAQDAMNFAYATDNATAYIKAVEHRSKLNGLLIERQHVKVETVDISGALEEASKRVELMREAKRVEIGEHDPLSQNDASSACTHILELSPSKSDETDQSEER